MELEPSSRRADHSRTSMHHMHRTKGMWQMPIMSASLEIAETPDGQRRLL